MESISKLCVIKPKKVQDRGMQIVDMNWVFDDVEDQFISLTMQVTGFDSASGKPHREAAVVVVAAIVSALYHRRAPKLDTPDYERVFQQATLP